MNNYSFSISDPTGGHRSREVMHIYTIYRNPAAEEPRFTVRRFLIKGGSDPMADPGFIMSGNDHMELRDFLIDNYQLMLVSRSPDDHHLIVESFI